MDMAHMGQEEASVPRLEDTRGVAPRRIFPEVDTTYFSISNINIFSVHYCTNHTTILRCNLTYNINNDHNCDITDIIPLFDSYSIL